MGSYTNCWLCDSNYRGLKKRITAIKQDKESSTEKHANTSLKSVPYASSDQAGSLTGLVDQGHGADNDTSMQYEKQKGQRVVDTHGDQIEDLNRKAGGSIRLEVNLAFLFFFACFQFSSQGDDLRLGVSRHAFCHANTHGLWTG
jgi:hypothetical protein